MSLRKKHLNFKHQVSILDVEKLGSQATKDQGEQAKLIVNMQNVDMNYGLTQADEFKSSIDNKEVNKLPEVAKLQTHLGSIALYKQQLQVAFNC